MLESVRNTFRSEDEQEERRGMTPLAWTDEEPLHLTNDNSVYETARYGDSLAIQKIRNRILLNKKLKHIQEELSAIERESGLMGTDGLTYYEL